jgi:hypothetical protein
MNIQNRFTFTLASGQKEETLPSSTTRALFTLNRKKEWSCCAMTVRRWVDAFVFCLLISLALMRRMPPREAFLFGAALFAVYLPGYLAVQHVGRQKYERAEAHVFNFSVGIALSSFGWLAATGLGLPVNTLTFAAVEAFILFVIVNIIWLRSIRNGH